MHSSSAALQLFHIFEEEAASEDLLILLVDSPGPSKEENALKSHYSRTISGAICNQQF